MTHDKPRWPSGPWIAEDASRYSEIYISEERHAGFYGRRALASVGYSNSAEDKATEEDRAIANLLSAAPDLYELVADAIDDVCENETEWNRAARAALAKAQGK